MESGEWRVENVECERRSAFDSHSPSSILHSPFDILLLRGKRFRPIRRLTSKAPDMFQ